MASYGWKRLKGERSASIEMHIGSAIAVFFFNNHGFVQPAKCYLLPMGIDQLDPLLPLIEKLIQSGSSLFVAVVTLNLLEVAPKSLHLPLIVMAAKTWLENFPHDRYFWVDHAIGRHVCMVIEKIQTQEPALFNTNNALRIDVDRLLAALITLGVPEAKRLEVALSGE
jgi:hypothetical protein